MIKFFIYSTLISLTAAQIFTSSANAQQLAQAANSAIQLPAAECGPSGSGYRLCVQIPGQPQRVANFADYVGLIYQFALAIAGIVVFIRITYGGILYILSAGSITKRDEAVKTITQAIWGLVLLLAAALILYIIDPRLLRLKLTPSIGSNNQGIFNFIKVEGPINKQGFEKGSGASYLFRK